MFNVGGAEMLVIMVVALVVLGPNRLPEAARQVGKWMGEIRRLSTGFQNEMRDAMSDISQPFDSTKALISGQDGAKPNGTGQNGTSQNGTGQNGTGQNGTSQKGTSQNGPDLAKRPDLTKRTDPSSPDVGSADDG